MDRDIVAAIRDWCKTKFQPTGNYAVPSDIPTQTSQLTNDSGYLTEVPVATESILGGVKPDGTTIKIDADGTIHAFSSQELAESILWGES